MINLEATFGDRYRVVCDPRHADPNGFRPTHPQHMRIPCRLGATIFAYTADRLAVSLNGNRNLDLILSSLGLLLRHKIDGEIVVIFPLSLFDAVAEIVRPQLLAPSPEPMVQ
jgi:hypothetical protein